MLETATNFLVKMTGSQEALNRINSLGYKDKGYGYDQFGFNPKNLLLPYLLLKFFYKTYFRVDSTGAENIPKEGPVILAPNHGGIIPIDAAMLAIDIVTKTEPPRLARAVVDRFVPGMPFVGQFFSRVGQVTGTRLNLVELIKNNEMLLIFPEGTSGISKPFDRRYRLRPFNMGFIELALEHKVPIVPVAIVGSEEHAPLIYKSKKLGKKLGFPFFPITPLFPLLGPLGFIPLPAKYKIRYGEPLEFYKEHGPETVKDPRTIGRLARKVKHDVQLMLTDLLKKRKHVFNLRELQEEIKDDFTELREKLSDNRKKKPKTSKKSATTTRTKSKAKTATKTKAKTTVKAKPKTKAKTKVKAKPKTKPKTKATGKSKTTVRAASKSDKKAPVKSSRKTTGKKKSSRR